MELKSIMTKDFEHCFLCGKQAEQWHHVMNKSYKKKSEKYGLLVPLCAKCHAKVHDSDESLNKELKRIAQADFLMEHSYELWIKEFDKNYI